MPTELTDPTVLKDPIQEFLANPPDRLEVPNPFATPAEVYVEAKPSDLGWVAKTAMAAGFIVATKIVYDKLQQRRVRNLTEARAAVSQSEDALVKELAIALGPSIRAAYGPGLSPAAAVHVTHLTKQLARVTTEAVLEGFIAGLNGGDAADVAWERATAGYGLDPQQMRSFIQAAKGSGEYEGKVISERASAMLDRYIATRADRIADTELFASKTLGQMARWALLASRGEIPEDAEKEWRTAADERVCPICGMLDRVRVPLDEPWMVGDKEIWAPGVHPNCRCQAFLIVKRGEEGQVAKAFGFGEISKAGGGLYGQYGSFWQESRVKRDESGQFSSVERRGAKPVRQTRVLDRPTAVDLDALYAAPSAPPRAAVQAPTRAPVSAPPGTEIDSPLSTRIDAPAKIDAPLSAQIEAPIQVPVTVEAPHSLQVDAPATPVDAPAAVEVDAPVGVEVEAPAALKIDAPMSTLQPVRIAIIPQTKTMDQAIPGRVAGLLGGAVRLMGQTRPAHISQEEWDAKPVFARPEDLEGQVLDFDTNPVVGFDATNEQLLHDALLAQAEADQRLKAQSIYDTVAAEAERMGREYAQQTITEQGVQAEVADIARRYGNDPDVIAYMETQPDDVTVEDVILRWAQDPDTARADFPKDAPLNGAIAGMMQQAEWLHQTAYEASYSDDIRYELSDKGYGVEQDITNLGQVSPTTFFEVEGGIVNEDPTAPTDLSMGAQIRGKYRVKGVRQVGSPGKDLGIDEQQAEQAALFDFKEDEAFGTPLSMAELEQAMSETMDPDDIGSAWIVTLEPIDPGAGRDKRYRRVTKPGEGEPQ